MKFDLPWRIHWKVGDPVSEHLVRSIRGAGPLVVTLEIESIGQLDALDVPWDGVSLVIVYAGWRETDLDILPDVAARWEFPIQDPAEALKLTEISFLGLPPARSAFRWFPRRGKVGDLLPILNAVREWGCGLTLPNRPAGVITSEGSEAFPEAGEVSGELLSGLSGFAGELKSDQVRIHDFILTEALGLQGAEPQGCEAGNSMAFIDGGGTVYPCETLMVPMGDLHSESLDAIWASPLRERIRRDVSAVPGLCAACRDLESCRGGCRGAVYHLSGHYGAPDPLCPVDREYPNE